MTDQPYTTADLHAEAALQYDAHAEDPDFGGVGEGMEGEQPWDALSEDDFHTAQLAIHDLRRKAAPLGHWAIRLGADDLEPSEDHVDVNASDDGRPLIRVHFAFLSDMPADMRAEFIASIAEQVAAAAR
ncbi:hypothetical protein OG455_41710 [Kitasatospora sp. NBC_01287]|uniref:hypothetical protein n=1 Tax=Kitasatospora sp. NBC_01287 TaxID=2903573 RepID=UPI002253F5F2|nr:hypothetical protein [Kitasatospora sp. NBC_01287]MCX4751747.1 hypothetical protein [Kitasatospora sp. NBC_01287]MCX4751961.1 hypothetical protein [Kitasatospora sp. NBC_01287]